MQAEAIGFPFVAQAARVERIRGANAPVLVELITSRPASELNAAAWLQANLDHWQIETGLHARLDASRDDDRCKLRQTNPLWLHGLFNRWANSLFIHWREKRPGSRHLTTLDFIARMSKDHDRRAISALTSKSFPS